MILTKEVEVKPSGKNIQYYRDKGYDAKWREALMVKVEDLPLRSDKYIITTCDYCGKEKPPIKYSDYNTETKNGTEKCCCLDCAYLKREETMIRRYGYSYALQNPEMMEKVQKTNMERYGSISPSGNEDVKKKMKETLMNNYGVECPSKSKEIREKIKQTNLERYGVENPSENNEIKEKIKKTNLDRYGFNSPMSNEEIKKKRDKTMLDKYGVLKPLQNEEIRQKCKQTNIERYGVENVSQLEEVKNKKKETAFEHFGVEYSSQSEEVKEKIRNTNIQKYGVASPLSLPSFHEHARQVDLEKYGVYHHLQNPEILAKQKETFYRNSTCPTSKQQLYIFNLYNQNNEAELNYPISHYNADICFPNEMLSVEIDFGGHNLGVKLGSMTQKEFERKEIIRNNVIKREGYKQMRIISSADLLPSDIILLQMLEYTRKYFSDYSNHSWVEFNLDTSIVRNAEQKDGVFFNFGELRKLPRIA